MLQISCWVGKYVCLHHSNMINGSNTRNAKKFKQSRKKATGLWDPILFLSAPSFDFFTQPKEESINSLKYRASHPDLTGADSETRNYQCNAWISRILHYIRAVVALALRESRVLACARCDKKVWSWFLRRRRRLTHSNSTSALARLLSLLLHYLTQRSV